MVKNGRTSVKQEEGTGPATEGNGAYVVYVVYLLVESFLSEGMKKFARRWSKVHREAGAYVEK